MLNYLLFFLLPAYLLRFSITNSLSVNFLELLLITVLFINIYIIIKTASFNYLLKQIILNKHIFLPFFLIVSGFTFSYLKQQILTDWMNWTDGFGKLLDLIILPIFYSSTLIMLSKLKKLSFLMLLKSYYLSALLVSFLGLVYFINDWLTFDGRLNVFFQSPNQLAIFIAPAILIGFYLFLTIQRTLKLNILLHLSLLLLIFTLYQTFSLGSWLAILFAIIYLFLTVRNSFLSFHLKVTVFMAVFFSLICILNIDLLLKTFNYQPQIPASSYDSRLTIYQVDQKIISINWLYGIGINNFQNFYLAQQKYFALYPQWAVPHAHNNLLHFWIEGGVMAGIGLFLLLSSILLPKKQSLNVLPGLSTTLLSSSCIIKTCSHATIAVCEHVFIILILLLW